MEAKPKLTPAYITQAVDEGGKFVGTSDILKKLYEKGGDAFPGIEKQIITSTDLSGIATGTGRAYWKKPTGLPGEFQLFKGAKPVMPNGLPVFLQEVVN
ncbi:MAG: hypothetical protein P2A85_11410 [Microcoleus anatoxicus]|uniref:hypothetical protein n=1 Tax=Microcoleus anatoxicus TaxID=2705319 RepID=UPI00366C238B